MDLRTRYTIKIINETFFNLLEQKSLKKITVSEICNIAEINRSTFYRYYKDVYDLVEQNINKILDEIAKEIDRNPFEMDKQFDMIFKILYDHKDIFILLKRRNALKDISVNIFRYFSNLSSDEYSNICHYFTYYGFVGVFRYWLDHDMEQSPDEMSKQAFELFSKIYM